MYGCKLILIAILVGTFHLPNLDAHTGNKTRPRDTHPDLRSACLGNPSLLPLLDSLESTEAFVAGEVEFLELRSQPTANTVMHRSRKERRTVGTSGKLRNEEQVQKGYRRSGRFSKAAAQVVSHQYERLCPETLSS